MPTISPESLIIWGAGAHAGTIADVARATGSYTILGFVDDLHPERDGELFHGARVFKDIEEVTGARQSGSTRVFVAIGHNRIRRVIYRNAISRGFKPATLIHPSASVAYDARIGEGTAIRAGAAIEADVHVGKWCIVGANVSMGHGCRMEDGARIALGACLSGNVTLRPRAMIGPGAVISNDVTIGTESLIGAGAVVVEDVPPGVVAFGNPARVVRDISESDF